LISFILRRLLLAIPTLFGVLVIVFLLLYVAPGDPVQEMVGERADPETVARLRAELRLDDPLHKQFVHYAGGVVQGDLGRSYITRRPILQDIRERFPKTLQLAGAAMLLASVIGITIGILSARVPGGWFDRISLGVAYLGISFPVYWVGLILILVFAVMLRWLPPSGYGGIEYLILRTARAKGQSERLVITRHALRNALIPIITVLGLDFGYYLTGSILTETIFSWPGLGRYVVNAISRRDLPAIQGSVLFLSVVFVLVNLITDLAYAKADPRVAYKTAT
jgi:ABC-type dipeptide/oligopeptide/nickel transport system permease component